MIQTNRSLKFRRSLILSLIIWFFALSNNIFWQKKITIPTSISINPPSIDFIFTPAHISWTFISWNIYAQITWEGILSQTYIISDNWTYIFDYQRWTWSYTTWAGFSSSNTRTPFSTTYTIDRIDNTPPSYSWFIDWSFYNTDITIYFTDNNPWVSATLNWTTITSPTTISQTWTYNLIITDTTSNITTWTFTIDRTKPTATIQYNPATTTNSNVIATLTWFNKTWVTITNNSRSNDYIFTSNWSFTFKFIDLAGNTWESTANVTWITTIPSWWWGWWSTPPATPPIPTTWQTETWQVPTVVDICKDIYCNSSYYQLICWECPTWDQQTWTQIPSTTWSQFDEEMISAYQYAFGLWITTIDDINQANLNWPLIRKHLAKMISEYAIKVVWLLPDNSKICEFEDTKDQTIEFQYYTKLSCKLNLMWLEADGITVMKNFYPDQTVNRAQFSTVFSRLIFGNTYNLDPQEIITLNQQQEQIKYKIQSAIWQITSMLWIRYSPDVDIDRYTKHLNALSRYKIIQIAQPFMKELRWYVMIMMMRADQNWIIQTHWSSKYWSIK